MKEKIMTRRLSFLAAAFLAITLVAGCGSKSAAKTTSPATTSPTTSTTPTTTSSASLVGTVGPGFTITLTQGGSPVTTLSPGTYKITVSDKAAIHNFHLFGPGVDQKTSVSGTGTFVWTVKLVKGSYTYQCDIHFASGMIGHFTVS
jgi:plastocyanin